MKIVTASDYKLKDFVKVGIHQVKKFDYGLIFYDLGDLNYGHKTFSHCKNRTTLKPEIIKDAIDRIKENELLIYLDADAILIKRIDELENEDFDIGITEKINYEYDTGVMFFRKNSKTLQFVDDWSKETKKLNNDKMAFESLKNDFINVKKYPNKVYNFSDFDKAYYGKSKILHFKKSHIIRERFYSLNKSILGYKSLV